ncbi:MAG TPA: DUF4350 domain-containing protein [Candidatus Dormibacteraeota bacterium]|nr:DUF4350 domain-containing protein [Candidatus Dormibacteraeota bacterium]
MPSTLDPGDRKILLIVGSFLLVLLIATDVLAPPSNNAQGQGIPSTYSTAGGGAQAAYLLLGQLGYRSERWEKSPTELPANTEGQILILARPSSFPEKQEREALLRFARSGGWVIYSGNFPYLFFDTGTVKPAILQGTRLPPATYPALVPSAFTRDAARITMPSRNRWAASAGNQVPLYGEPDAPVVVTWRLGKGRILWWAAPTPVTNAGISNPGNLAFLLDCIQAARPGAPPGRTTVLWDEYFHGYRGSLWDYFRETPVPWAIFQLALAAALILFTFSRRSGPLYAPVTTSRLSPLEFVDTLGDLYRRGNAGPAAVSVAYQRFRTQLTRRLALSPSISNAQLDAAVRGRLGWKQPGLFDTLQHAEKAVRAGELTGADALRIVQALEHYEFLLGLKKRPAEEKP